MNVKKASELIGHTNPIFTLELSQKQGILFTAGNDKGVVEWSLKDDRFIKVLFPVSSTVYALHCPENFPVLLAGLRNGEVVVFDFIAQKIVGVLKHHTKPVFDVKSIIAKKELLVASEDGQVSVWNMETWQLVHTITVSNDTVRSIALHPNGNQIAFGCRDSTIKIYDTEDFYFLGTCAGHDMPVFAVAYAPKEGYLVSGSRDAQLKVWDVADFQLTKNIPAHLFAVNHIVFHPTRPYFASASMDKSIKIWGADDFKLYKIISREKGYESHHLSINKIAWYGDQLISVSDDKKVIVWDIEF
jgi:WD40 repeat protein